MNPIKFSITIPAYKASFLYEAIQSCLNQTYEYFELIIVDDHSPEDLISIVEMFDDNRIKYYRNETNCGALNVVDNWNICLSYCSGDYVVCMGDDDRLTPHCLETYYKYICQYPDCDVFHAATEIIDEKSNFVSFQESRPEWESVWACIWWRWAFRDHQYIGDFCFRRSELVCVGGFYKLPLAWFSDDISVALLAAKHGVVNTREFCFQYRENGQTITSSGNTREKMNALLLSKDWYSRFIQENDVYNEEDGKYKKLILDIFPRYWGKRVYTLMIDGCVADYGNLIYWLKHRKEIGASFLMVCKALVHSIYYRISHRF